MHAPETNLPTWATCQVETGRLVGFFDDGLSGDYGVTRWRTRG